jgi:branched-chain amino acid transport system ATP-binding protein
MILQVEGVVKRFGGLVALNDATLHIEEGEIFGLIGPNGAGKSTLLNVIAGMYRPDAGSVCFEGADITGLSPQRICRKGIARTFQISHPFSKMSAIENVLVAATFGSRESVEDPWARAQEMLDFVEFPMPGDTLAGSLNAGQLRRLDVARALASDPRLLLLDEAAAGLTPGELTELQALIRKIRDQGITILIVEHVMRLIMQLCDRIAVLHYGAKIADGTPCDIAEDERVQDAYLGEKYIL